MPPRRRPPSSKRRRASRLVRRPAAAARRTALKPLATAKDLAPGRTLGDTQLAALGWTLQLKAGNKLGE